MTTMIGKEYVEPAFKVRRLSPDETIHLLEVWAKHENLSDTKSYNITNDDQRYELVRRVLAKEVTIKEAAKVYGMKYTTAKTIMKIYRREGRFGKKKQRMKKGYTKLLMAKLPSEEKPESPASNSTDNACLQSEGIQGEPVTSGKGKILETTLCQSFWGEKISSHFC